MSAQCFLLFFPGAEDRIKSHSSSCLALFGLKQMFLVCLFVVRLFHLLFFGPSSFLFSDSDVSLGCALRERRPAHFKSANYNKRTTNKQQMLFLPSLLIARSSASPFFTHSQAVVGWLIQWALFHPRTCVYRIFPLLLFFDMFVWCVFLFFHGIVCLLLLVPPRSVCSPYSASSLSKSLSFNHTHSLVHYFHLPTKVIVLHVACSLFTALFSHREHQRASCLRCI